MCDSCTKRRLWIAIRRVDKKQEDLDMLDALDDLVAKAYQGDTEAVMEVSVSKCKTSDSHLC
jgi:hypothetical protein